MNQAPAPDASIRTTSQTTDIHVEREIHGAIHELEARGFSSALKIGVGFVFVIAMSIGSWLMYTTKNSESRLDVMDAKVPSFVIREELSGLKESITELKSKVGYIQEEQSKSYVVQQQMLKLQSDQLRQQDRMEVVLEEIRADAVSDNDK